MSDSRLSMNPIARIRRFARRAGSPMRFFNALFEEALVRAWSHEQIRSVFRPFFRRREPQRWVFLVGCYNSGTTLLQHVLSANEQIAGLPREGVRFTSVLSNLEENDHHMMWDENYRLHAIPAMPKEKAYQRIIADWAPFWKKDAAVFLDKSVANTARIDWLLDTFPNSLCIGIHRNGYCIAEGLHRRGMPPAWYREKTGSEFYPLDATGKQWVVANEDMLAAFAENPRCRLVSFEELVEKPEAVVAGIFEFIGVDPGVIRRNGRTLTVGGRSFEIRNPNPSSLARLSEADKELLTAVIGPMMQKLGYDT